MVINQINLDPAKWENKTVVVTGKLSDPFAYPTAISCGFVLSSNEMLTSQINLDVNSIGVDFRNGGAQLSCFTVSIVGVVEKGVMGTNVAGEKPATIYYIEEQAILTS